MRNGCVSVRTPVLTRQVVDGVDTLAAAAPEAEAVRGPYGAASLLICSLRNLQGPHRGVPLVYQHVHLLQAQQAQRFVGF